MATLKQYLDDRKRCSMAREFWTTKRRVSFKVDFEVITFSLLPVIVIVPWMYRRPGWPVLEIYWLCFHASFGEFVRKVNI